MVGKAQPAGCQKFQVEADAVPHNRGIAHKSGQVLSHFMKARRISDLDIADAGQPCYEFRNMSARVNEGRPLVFDAATLELDRPDLDDRVAFLTQPGGLNI